MNQSNRMSWALGISLLIWAPVALAVINGGIDIMLGGIYYLAALGLSWFGIGMIMGLTTRYRSTIDELERAKHEIEEIERRSVEQMEVLEEEHNRRANDRKDS